MLSKPKKLFSQSKTGLYENKIYYYVCYHLIVIIKKNVAKMAESTSQSYRNPPAKFMSKVWQKFNEAKDMATVLHYM